jgi:hypothetical protein
MLQGQADRPDNPRSQARAQLPRITVGVALAGVVTAYAAEALGARLGLLIFGMAVVVTALVLTVVWVKDTLPWAKAETAAHKLSAPKLPA